MPSGAFLWCVVDKMFIEVPSFQETLSALKNSAPAVGTGDTRKHSK